MYPNRKNNLPASAKERAASRLEELRKQEQLILEKKRLIEEQLKNQTNTPSSQLVQPVPKVDPGNVKKPLFHRLRSQLNMHKKVQQQQQQQKQQLQLQQQQQQKVKSQVTSFEERQVSSFTTSLTSNEKDDKNETTKTAATTQKLPPLNESNMSEVEKSKEENGSFSSYSSSSSSSSSYSQTTSRCKEAECCAIYVAINGDEEEVNLTSRLANDPKYTWLIEKESIDYKYFRHRVEQLRSANEKQLLDHSKVTESSICKSTDREKVKEDEGDEKEQEEEAANDIEQEQKTRSEPSQELGKKKLKSRWGDPNDTIPLDADLIEYAKRIYGSVDLHESQWRQLEDQRKMRMLTNIMKARKESVYSLHKRRSEGKKAKNKYEYDSDEDTEGGTWEHKRRQEEMDATSVKAQQLTQMNKSKHHIGDFLPPDELEKFIKAWEEVKDGKASQLIESAYEKFKLTSNNIGYKMLKQMGWKETQGLGRQPNTSRIEPIACSSNAGDRSGLGVKRPSQLTSGDDEYEAYRKRMMIAYRFRPNPLNNPRREYY